MISFVFYSFVNYYPINCIQCIKKKYLQGLPELDVLVLSDNPLEELNVDWSQFPKLREIYANNCKLDVKSFNESFFQSSSFRRLSFENNQIHSIDRLLKLRGLVILHMRKNESVKVDQRLLDSHESLNLLDIRDNPIKLELNLKNENIKIMN